MKNVDIMKKEWIYCKQDASATVETLASELNIPRVIAQILVNREITTSVDAKRFFRPHFSDLYDPFLMKNMEVAVNRIQMALRLKEKILIYGDYDVDGITACSLLYLYFKELTDQVYFFIPERLKEGYGFSLRGVEEARRLGVTLIITVDCGITSIEEINSAQGSGIDVIVTDHHQPGQKLPPAYTILNPIQGDCSYPFKGLSGVGVAFKLVHALDQIIGRGISHLIQYTDLVAIGSSADVVPLVDENRILVHIGLERINNRHNMGINALLSVASLNSTFIGTGQILFGIAPRINAVGRLGSAERAVKLFTTSTPQQALEIARVLEEENRQRKNIEEKTFNEAVDAAELEFNPASPEPLVLSQEGWHPGVIGIVASRLVDKYFRPAVMIAIDEGMGKGSIRSVPEFDVYTALKNCSEYLKEFGGHRLAAGLAIEASKIPAFKEAFKKSVRETITLDALKPKLFIDARIAIEQIDGQLYTLLRHFSPYGPQNTRPVFLIEHAEVVGTPVIVGKNHLKFTVRQNGMAMSVIGFNMGEFLSSIDKRGSYVDIACVIDENVYHGVSTIQLQVIDLRISNN